MSKIPHDESSKTVSVEVTPRFTKRLLALSKRYRNIQKDIQPTIEDIQKGIMPGDQISGIDYMVFKVRVRNKDIKKGKSAGYRLIYQLESPTSILLLTIYSKSDTDDVNAQTIAKIIADYHNYTNT
jgi:mRNA-degrading endonuclease RelE of RelBE toxin-antitoxin system